jgi:hypothetical protein
MRWLVLLCACATAPTTPPLTCPQRGGRAWAEAHSSHFLLRTDLPATDAQGIIDELERSFEALDQLFRADLSSAPPIPTEPVSVVMFADAGDMAALYPAYPGGGFYTAQTHEWDPRPVIIMSGSFNDSGRQLIRHELTHRFVHHYLPTAPAWLNEGLANLYSTLRLTGEGAVVGRWDDRFRFAGGYMPDVREVFVAGEATFHDDAGYGYYKESHALVHLLQNPKRPYRAAFVGYLQRLSTGIRADLAWRDSFGKLDADTLERALNGYWFVGLRTDTRTVPLKVQAARATVATLNDGEVHALWAELRPWKNPENRRRAEADLVEAERQAPGSARVKYWRAVFDVVARRGHEVEKIRAALEADPGNQRLIGALYLWTRDSSLLTRLDGSSAWQVLLSPRWNPSLLERYRRAVTIAPADADVWHGLAYWAAYNGELTLAATSAQRSAWLAPGDGFLVDALRNVLHAARGGLQLSPPWGELSPPPERGRYGVTLNGAVVDGAGRPVAAWVHGAGGGQFDMVRTSSDGKFALKVPPGKVNVWVIPDDDKLLGDHWWRGVRPSAAPVDVGRFAVAEGRLPLKPRAFDGIEPVSIDARVVVQDVQGDSPAERSGAQKGDEILAVNGHATSGLGSQAVNLLLAGEPGARTAVVVRRAGQERTLEFELAPTTP